MSRSFPSSPDHQTSAMKSRSKRRSTANASRSSKNKVVKLNGGSSEQSTNQYVQNPNNENDPEEDISCSKDPENKSDDMFVCSENDLDNPLQIDIPSNLTIANLSPLKKDTDSVNRDEASVDQRSTDENAKNKDLSFDASVSSNGGKHNGCPTESVPEDLNSREAVCSGGEREADGKQMEDSDRSVQFSFSTSFNTIT